MLEHRWKLLLKQSEIIYVRNGCERDSGGSGIEHRVNPAEVHGVLPIPLVQLINDRANCVALLVVLEQGKRVQFIRHKIEEPNSDLQWFLCRTRIPQLRQVLLEDNRVPALVNPHVS